MRARLIAVICFFYSLLDRAQQTRLHRPKLLRKQRHPCAARVDVSFEEHPGATKVNTHIKGRIYVYVCVYTVYAAHKQIHTYIHVYIHIYIYIHIRLYMYTYVETGMHIYIYVCIYIFIYTHTGTCR